MRKRRGLCTVTLAALVIGCSSLQEKRRDLEAVAAQTQSSREQTLPSEENREYIVTVSSFKKYDPLISEELIAVKDDVRRYLDQGLDYDHDVIREMNIGEYVAFENLIYDEAKKLGYTSKEVQQMSPREAAKLTCDLLAQRMNYFGITQDYNAAARRKKDMGKTRDLLVAVLKDEGVKEDEKENAKEKIKFLDEMEKKWGELEDQERRTTKKIANLVSPHDKTSIDNLFREQETIVCRQYARIANGIFFVLKNKNQNLQNTFVSDYTDNNHCWNQISTLYKKDGKIHIDISFFDPTWHDTDNHIEGYDMRHFPSDFLLMSQCNKLQGKVIEQPTTRPSLPWVRFR